MQAAHGYSIDPMWGFESLAHLLTHNEKSLSYELSLAIAAQAAHEALEWLRFDGELVVDPHAPSDAAIDGLVRYFKAAADS